MTTTSFNVIATEGRFAEMHMGVVVFYDFRNGWRFIPMFQAKPSRKFHVTAEAAVKNRVKHFRLEAIK